MSRIFYGWTMVGVAAAAMVGTLPGRTQGLGLITEPLLADLHIDRVAYAELNFWATIVGSAFALGVGRYIDRFGSRLVLTLIAFALGVVVCLMSRAAALADLAVWVTLTRGLGQSALSVISLAMVGQWFARRIDTAMAVYSVVMSVGFMIAFPVVGAVIQTWGWRSAWVLVGLALAVVLAPLAWLLVRRGPEEIGVYVDGGSRQSAVGSGQSGVGSRESAVSSGRSASGDQQSAIGGYTWREALGTATFWLFAIGAALYGLVASGIGLFNESILAERGFDATIYYQTLIVTAMTALAGNFLGGWLAARVSLTRLMATSLFILAGGLAALPWVSTIAQVMAWATAMGLGGGLVMVLFFSVWPRVYGRRHLGRIQGAAQALTVLASALGPLLLAWCVAWTGSYGGMFYMLSAAVGLVGLAGLVVTLPPRRT